MKKLFALLFYFFLASAATLAEPIDSATKIPVVSYIRTWGLGASFGDLRFGERWTASDVHAEYLSALEIAFAVIRDGVAVVSETENQIGGDGKTVIKGFTNLWSEIAALKAKFPHLKINVSVGGWGEPGFSDAALTTQSRGRLVQSLAKILREHDLDGIDIDWEFPVGPDWGQPIKSRPEDRENYLALMKDLRAGLNSLQKETGKTYRLTTAVPGVRWFIQKIDVLALSQLVDSLHLMTYDFHGTWNEKTGHLANLSRNPADPDGWSIEEALQLYFDAKVPPEKILLGLPFYGFAWEGVEKTNNGLFQKVKKVVYPYGIGAMDIRAKILGKNGFVRYWDDVAQAPYLYNGDVFVTYDDEQSLKIKAVYALKKRLGGVMIWEYADDLDAQLLKALNSSLR